MPKYSFPSSGSADLINETVYQQTIAMNIRSASNDWAWGKTKSVGDLLSATFGLTDCAGLGTWAAIVASSTAMAAIKASTSGCAAVASSSAAIAALDASSPTIVPTMTSNTAPSGTASASAEYAAGNAAWKAFDGDDTGQGWLPTIGAVTNAWLRYSFTSNVWVYKIKLIGFSDTRTPKNCKIQYSIDGTNWIDAVSFVNLNNYSLTPQYFSVCVPSVSTAHWRLLVVDTYSATEGYVGTLQIYGK